MLAWFKKTGRLILLGLLSILLLKSCWLTLMNVDAHPLVSGTTSRDLLRRRAYLVTQLQKGQTPSQMPDYLPEQFKGEWALVSYSMATAALTNIAMRDPSTEAESLTIVTDLIEQVLTEEFRTFDSQRWGSDPLQSLGTDEGHIGYLGHLNFMLAAYHVLGGDDPEYTQLFSDISAHLSQIIETAPSLNGATYPSEIYVPDNTVVIASLALHDQLLPQQATGTAAAWVQFMDEHMRDEETGLFPFSVWNGRAAQPPRGSGSGWNSFFLFYADPDLATQQYQLLQEHYGRDLWLGGYAINEWPDGGGWGDLDSGPLLLGMSPTGTSFGLAGAVYTGDEATAEGILFVGEAAGFSWPGWNGRHYLMAPMVGDAILTAMMSVTSWEEDDSVR